MRTRSQLPNTRLTSLWNGATRAGIVVFGGLLVLQSSDQLSQLKIAYLVVASIAVGASILSVWIHRGDAMIPSAFPWIVVSIIMIGLIVVSFPVARAHNTPLASWLRDASGYGLIATAPWLAIDLAKTAPRRWVLSMLLVAGTLGVAAFVVDWVQRRRMADLPIDRLALSSFALAAFFYCVACALSVTSPRRWAWTSIAAVILVALLVTGTRSSLVILAAPVALLLVALRSDRARLMRVGTTIVIQVAAVAIVLLVSLRGSIPLGNPVAAGLSPSLEPSTMAPSTSARSTSASSSSAPSGAAPSTSAPPGSEAPASLPATPRPIASPPEETPQPDILAKRFGTLADLLAGRDSSFRERIQQSGIAWDAFTSSPIVGVGLGYDFAPPSNAGAARSQFTLDTPVIALAKFGILALVLLVAVSVAFAVTIRDLVRREHWSWVTLAVIAYAVLLVVILPLGWPPEDKGMGFALILLLAAVFARPRSVDDSAP